MSLWTVISTTDAGPDGAHTLSPFAAVAGRVDVYGLGLHTATVIADDADQAVRAVGDAARITGGVPRPDLNPPAVHSPDGRWTVIGTADNGACPSWTALAVVPGEHSVDGRFESMLTHRWDVRVTADAGDAALNVGYDQVAPRYEEAWD